MIIIVDTLIIMVYIIIIRLMKNIKVLIKKQRRKNNE